MRVSVSIANGASLSGGVAVPGLGRGDNRVNCVVGVQMPAAWTAANLTFQASADGGTTYNNVHNDGGTEYTATAAVDRFIYLNPDIFRGATHVKIRSGTAGVPVNQGAARTLWLLVAPA